MSETLVKVTRDGSRGTLSLNRPEKRNAISLELLKSFEAAIAEVRDDPSIRVVVIDGIGKAFSSGVDHSLLMELFSQSESAPFRHLHGDLHRAMDQLTLMEKPVIARLHGAAVGFGMEIALAADFRIVEESCIMGLPEVAFGIIPDVGGTTRLTRLVGPQRAKELILTGRLQQARCLSDDLFTARAVGLEELDEKVSELVESLAALPPAALGIGKVLIERVADCSLADGLRLEGVYQSILIQHPDINDHFMGALAFIKEQFDNARRS